MRDVLDDWKATVERATAALRTLSDEESGRRRAPGKWSTKETVGHLIDSAANNHQRFVRAQFQEDLVFAGYAQDEWVAAQRYQDAPWPLLVDLWRSYNLELARISAAIPEETLRRPRTRHSLDQIAWRLVPAHQPVSLKYLIADYVNHLRHHLAQILPGVIAPPGRAETEGVQSP
jgi:hypothetical protein